MRKSNITAIFKSDVKTVWNIITNNADYTWRSDLSRIDILDNGERFIEYTKGGFSTTFTIIKKEQYKIYEFDMENKNMTGHWIGIFSETKDNGTRIDFAEEINIKNPILKALSYMFMNIKKMQETYVTDLRKRLDE